MSKIIFYSLILLTAASFIPISKPAYALGSCPSSTAYTMVKRGNEWVNKPISSADRIAQFYINVGNVKNFQLYKMRFICGIETPVTPYFEIEAKEYNDAWIWRELDKSTTSAGTPCEFDTEQQHKIIVNASTNGRGSDLCEATYTVVNSDTQCELKLYTSGKVINPGDKVITSTIKLSVSGENLTKNGRFGLFIDNDIIKGSHQFDFVDTNKGSNGNGFTEIEILNKYLTLGRHVVSLRNYIGDAIWTSPRYSDNRLCPVVFDVGTEDNKGTVFAPGTITGGCAPNDLKCSSGGGESCVTEENRGPAFETAIGCIHTNPAEFVKDFMTWVLGIGGGLAFLMMLAGAFQMLTSAGNPETLNAGRDRLTSAIIGLLMVIFAILLLQIIGVGILSIPGFK